MSDGPRAQARPRVLVLIRLGADHRVSGWAKTPRAERDWDLVLSPYQDVPDLAEFEPDEVLPEAGGKWDAIHRLLTRRTDLLERAPRVWLPDDDLEADAAIVARFLDVVEAHDLALAQPALTPDSAFSHAITVRNRFARLRPTNFVELMAPILSTELLRVCLPEMEGRPAAKGLDFVWAGHVRGAGRVAIVDAAAVAHRRPIGRHLAGRARAKGHDVDAERDAWMTARFGRRWGRPVALGPGGRAGATLLTLLSFATTPALWTRANAPRLGKHLLAQLIAPARALAGPSDRPGPKAAVASGLD
ncbi:MAG: DUF707 domain-containing protein [Pseudomonadota bacterium]